jgi:hypothetical protein
VSLVEKIIRYPALSVGILFLLVEAFICPYGDFPLNDDWAYALCVKNFVRDGNFNFSFWQAIPNLPSIFAGIIFCKVFGFSFVVLRMTSILLTFSSVLLLGHTLGKYHPVKRNIFLILLVFAFNPLVFNLSNTFMPENMLTFLTIACIHFILSYLTNETKRALFFLSLFSLLAVLSRQSALIIPLSFVLVHFLLKRKEKWLSFIPLLVSSLALFLFNEISKSKGILPANYGLQANGIFLRVLHPNGWLILKLAYYPLNSLICLGLFLLPISLSFFNELKQILRANKNAHLVLFFFLIWTSLKLYFASDTLPSNGNMLYQGGLGPVIMNGMDTDHLSSNSFGFICLNLVLNATGILSCFLLFFKCRSNILNETQRFFALFTFALTFTYLIAISLNFANDRYLVFILPFLFFVFLFQTTINIRTLKFTLPFIFLALYAILGTKDYLNLNEQRKNAGDFFVREKKLAPCDIDGGFEYNGWNCSSAGNYIPTHQGRWWWVKDDRNIISTEKLDSSYAVQAEYNSFQFLRSDISIYCLSKKSDPKR